MNPVLSNQKGGAIQLPARWYCDSTVPFKGCQCQGAGCQRCQGQLYSCGQQSGPVARHQSQATENFTVDVPTTPKQMLQRVQKAGQALFGESQEGGAIRFPVRYFHPEADPFKGPQCTGSQVSSTIHACGGASHPQQGGGYASVTIPQIQYGNSEPINPQALTLNQKAATRPSSFDYHNVYSQWPCQRFDKQYKYYDDLNQHNCQSRTWPRNRPNRPEDAQLVAQEGGSGAPFSIWNQGAPLTQSYPHVEGPLFVPVNRSTFRASCGCAGQQ